MVNKYIPEKGDIVWLNFNPQAGKEQFGHRPALVITSSLYNKQGLMIACPITSKVKGYPFEVLLSENKIQGAVLVDHIKSVDWKERKASFEEKSSPEVMKEVQGMLAALIMQ